MFRIAIIGASGAVGRRMVADLEFFGIRSELGLFASARSAGMHIKYFDRNIEVQEFQLEKLSGFPFVLMSAGGAFSKEWAKKLSDQGSVIIDNSSAWRMDDSVPLVVPEVNVEILTRGQYRIIANPNCSTIQLVVALKPLLDNFGLEWVNVATYQSVSGSGQKGIEELRSQLVATHNHESNPALYVRPILNNLIPAIDVIKNGGHCYEEEKMIRETRKILSQEHLCVFVSTVRVPVLHCHSEAVTVGLKKNVSRKDVMEVFHAADGIDLRTDDHYEGFPYPLEVAGRRDVSIGRIRLGFGEDSSRIVQFWNVADNLNKGAATNAVQILKTLL